VAVFVWWLFWWLLAFAESSVAWKAHVNGCSVAVSGFCPSNIE
jgi:membrane associated rhomboid family serine protease